MLSAVGGILQEGVTPLSAKFLWQTFTPRPAPFKGAPQPSQGEAAAL